MSEEASKVSGTSAAGTTGPGALQPVYFADVFGVTEEVLENYGAFNIALVNDLPLFVDPFLLYDSADEKYRHLHDDIITYLCFIRDRALADELSDASISHWLKFKEVKQNWLGFSTEGNAGTGLGPHFGHLLARNLKTVFADFGRETVTRSSHLEKLGLLAGGVGRDHLSDFTTNLIKGFLLEYTQAFARAHLAADRVRRFRVERVTFDYESRRWRDGSFDLPYHRGDYVLLTPKEILTRDEAWISQADMLDRFTDIRAALPDAELRHLVNEHFERQISERSTNKERREAALRTAGAFPKVLDFYIRGREDSAPEAHRASDTKVRYTETQFITNVKALIDEHLAGTEFYRQRDDSYEESLRRVLYLKHVIEDQGGHRVFYVDGVPVRREVDLDVMFRLTWMGTALDLNAEVNNGRGPADFKVSHGKADATIVEFKLAKNTSLERNLEHQTAIYERASDAARSIKVIVYFSEAEFDRVQRILERLDLVGREDVVLIDASLATKVSASLATTS